MQGGKPENSQSSPASDGATVGVASSSAFGSDTPTIANAGPLHTPALSPNKVLGGRYEILQMLGEGGMGAVYKARDLEVNQLVALKVIRPDLASNPAIIERFKQELILARQVTHKNVIRIYDLAEADGVKFITMEYVEGAVLRAIAHEKK